MRWLRGPGRVVGGCLLVALLLPGLAPWPSSVLDRGPGGSARFSMFPLALAAFDPFVWTCARNSAAVAGVVAAGSLSIGVGLALIAGRWRFWGRAPLMALAMAPMAAGPLMIAPGVRLILGGDRGWDWLAARSILGFSAEEMARWAALVWVGLASGVPLVAMATSAALRRVDPCWSEAARAVGASRRRAWREVVWPILRPEAARASASVFTIALVEPAGPMVLGLGRTLAMQIVGSATRLDEPTRVATLAILAIAIAAAARVLIGWWGGPSYVRGDLPDVAPIVSASFRRASIARMILAAWVAFAVGPVAVLLLRAFQSGRAASPDSWSTLALGWLAEPEARAWAVNSSTTAGIALAIDLLILSTLFRKGNGPAGRSVHLASRAFEAVPPLAMGVGALATPWLLAALAEATAGPFGARLGSAARELDPSRSPGLVLALALAAGRLPMLVRVAELARGQIRPIRVDAARLMGASDRRSRTAGEGRWLGGLPRRPVLLALALAATNLAPALLLTRFSERRTLAPAVFGLLLDAHAIDPRVLGPVAAILGVNLLALALAARGRVGPIGDWFRG